MLARLRHPLARAHVCVHDARAPTRDPTGTIDIRKRFKGLLDSRWRTVSKLLKGVVVSQDILGLHPSPTATSIAAGRKPEDRLKALQTLVDDWLDKHVVGGDKASWLAPMLRVPYQRGLARAIRLTEGNAKSEARDIAEAIGALHRFAIMELQGIAEAVSQRIMRNASMAILDALPATRLMQEIESAIEKIGVTRGRSLVEVMVVKAHATATLDHFEVLGMAEVGVVPETVPKKKRGIKDAARGPGSRISREHAPSRSTIRRIRKVQEKLEKLGEVDILTAGDDDVCEICETLSDGGPWPINTARSMIPAHPNCRCAFVPYHDGRFASVHDPDDDDE